MVDNLGDALLVLYPDATPNVDYLVADTGAGPEIVEWRLGGMPSRDDLAAASLSAYRRGRSRAIDARALARLDEGFGYAGRTVALDPDAQSNWMRLFVTRDILAYPLAIPVADGTLALVDAATLRLFYVAFSAAIQAILNAGNARKAQVAAARTRAEIDAVPLE